MSGRRSTPAPSRRSARSARSSPRTRRSSPTATTSSAPRPATARPGAKTGRGADGAARQRPLARRLRVDALGRWQYSIVAWIDRLASWRHELQRKVEGGQDRSRERARRRSGAARRPAARPSRRRSTPSRSRTSRARPRPRATALELIVDRDRATLRRLVRALPALVRRLRRRRARRCPSSPRSASTSSTSRRSTRSAVTHRKGRNNALVAEPDDPGSPWAIGATEGGHTAVAPGARHDRGLRAARRRAPPSTGSRSRSTSRSSARPTTRGSPSTPTGSSAARRDAQVRREPAQALPGHLQPELPVRGLAGPLEGAPRRRPRWAGRGVRIFRVDNPHTKPVAFWSWLIREAQAVHPDVVFLSEAFTRPAMMATLAKAGFSQSYTYFTWRNTQRGARPSTCRELTSGDLPRVLPAEPLHEHAGHPHRVPAARRPPGVRGAARARRDALAELRHLLRASRTCEGTPREPGARSTSTRRSTS